MDRFEQTAFLAMIQTMKMQLQAFETLIAASGNKSLPATHKSTPTMDVDTHELSEEDEEKLAETLQQARNEEIGRMKKRAEAYFQEEAENIINSQQSLNG